MNINNQIIIITGVTKGLGMALAKEYIKQGHMVVGCGRNASVISSMSDLYSIDTDFQVVDISNHKQVSSWAQNIINKYGPPDYLINNAGVINKNNSLWNISPDEFSSVIDINIKGVYNTIKEY